MARHLPKGSYNLSCGFGRMSYPGTTSHYLQIVFVFPFPEYLEV